MRGMGGLVGDGVRCEEHPHYRLPPPMTICYPPITHENWLRPLHPPHPPQRRRGPRRHERAHRLDARRQRRRGRLGAALEAERRADG